MAAIGVDAGDAAAAEGDPAVLIVDGTWRGMGGCWYETPSSPGWKFKLEQNPSDDVISSVLPSFDLRESQHVI